MLRLAGSDHTAVARLVHGYGLDLRLVDPGVDIPGSYWGESEAGLQGSTLLARTVEASVVDGVEHKPRGPDVYREG